MVGMVCLALTIGFSGSACSFSYKLGGLVGKDADKTAASSALSKPADKSQASEDLPPDADLVYARAAASEVLARGGSDTSLPWENPASGARGTVTPLTTAYDQDGFLCRDFLASYVRQGSEAWLQGEACRVHQGRWEVKHLRTWKRT
jgi:surface antigen